MGEAFETIVFCRIGIEELFVEPDFVFFERVFSALATSNVAFHRRLKDSERGFVNRFDGHVWDVFSFVLGIHICELYADEVSHIFGSLQAIAVELYWVEVSRGSDVREDQFEVGGGDAFFGVALAGFCGGLAAGVGKEYGDECAEGNYWSWQDIAADCIGALCGGGLAAIIGVIF